MCPRWKACLLGSVDLYFDKGEMSLGGAAAQLSLPRMRARVCVQERKKRRTSNEEVSFVGLLSYEQVSYYPVKS